MIENQSSYLHFDILLNFKEYDLVMAKSCDDLVMLRLRLPVVIALAVIQSLVLHVFRFFTYLMAGILTLSFKKIFQAIKELVSLPIEIIALLISGLVALFFRKAAILLLDQVLLLDKRKPGQLIIERYGKNSIGQFSKYITCFVRGIFVSTFALIFCSLAVIKNIIRANSGSLRNSLALLFYGTMAPFIALFKKDAANTVSKPYIIVIYG